ncbi:MAG: hypothetical protein JXB15_04100 [Anaerolineales bacterium]|nr:hypothetical protein [Anaerolineales bacterium]
MKIKALLIISILALITMSVNSAGAAPLSAQLTGVMAPDADVSGYFTYQGFLKDNSAPANGQYDMLFRLYDAASSGNQIGSSVTKDNVVVTDGLFVVSLNFGADKFSGIALYLDIAVRPGASSGGYTSLTSRQELTAVPYAMNVKPGARILGVYGGGIWRAGALYTNYYRVGNLPYNNTNTHEKLLVTVWGGGWYNNHLGEDTYSISSRGGLKITRTRLYGSTQNYSLRVYDNGSSYDVVVRLLNADYPSLAIRSFGIDEVDGYIEMPVTEGYSISGKTDVTPTIEEHIMMNNDGYMGIGKTPSYKLDVNGTTQTKTLRIIGGSDLAEPFEIAGAETVQPGMLVSIDPEHPGQLRMADSEYDRLVAGCVSGAGGVQPGLVMQQEDSPASGTFPVALSGRVYCWADASYGPIHPGDMLTSSSTPGHVMAVLDFAKAQGTIIGKAMSGLEAGVGLILVLVTLQ